MESGNLVRSLTSHSSGGMTADIQLSSVSAKTRVLPPITYWEKYSGPQGSANHAESVWRHLRFHLKLRITSIGIRYFNLYCLPLHPFGQSPEAIEFSWSVSGGQLILAGIRVGIKSGEHYVDLRLRAEGRYTPGLVRHLRSMPNHWTTIPESLRDAMRSAGGLIHLRIVLEDNSDLPMLESFFSSALEVNEPLRRPEIQYSNLQVATERQPPRPQTNPHLDPLVYDPFPGIPIRLGRITHELPELKSKSSTPGEPSQALAAMELSDGGAEDGDRNEDHPKTPSSDIGSKGSSSSAWSFLGKSRGQNPDASSSSSSSSSSPLMSPPPPPPPSPPVVLKRPPVVVKLEPESDSDTHIFETRKRKSNRLGGTGEGGGTTGEEVRVKEKRKKKRRDVVETILVKEEEAHDDNEEAEGGDEEAEAERKRKKKERKKKRRNRDLDGDIDMETDVQSVDVRPTKKKSKKSRRKAPISTSGSPISIQSPPPKKTKKKKGKERSKEKQPEFGSDDRPSLPPIEPSRSGSENRKHTKRKHLDSDSGDNNDEVSSERLSRRRERLKKRINEINMEKHELRVEEEELKAKLLRLDFTTRQLDTGTIRAHCVCSACKKYGHKKNSVICEMHPDAIRIAAWRGRR